MKPKAVTGEAMADLDDLDPNDTSFTEKDEPTDMPVADPDAQAHADEDQAQDGAADPLAEDDSDDADSPSSA
jgi:hypothetical protein